MSTTTPVQTAPTPTTPNGSNRRILDAKAFLAILNARKLVTRNHIGQQVLLSVQGQGQFLPKGFQYEGPTGVAENQFDRTIYNVRANSQLAMLRKENKQLLSDALKAESAGDTARAHDLFNAYLNAVQISFSVIMPSNRKFVAGDAVMCWVAEYTQPVTGMVSLVINDVRLKPPTEVATATFAISDLIDQEA